MYIRVVVQKYTSELSWLDKTNAQRNKKAESIWKQMSMCDREKQRLINLPIKKLKGN